MDGIYAGPKAALRPIHDALMAALGKFGEFEVAPKEGYLSLCRKKQFAMVGPGTNTRIDVGINVKDEPSGARLKQQPPKSMCTYKVGVQRVAEVDQKLLSWLRRAYQEAA